MSVNLQKRVIEKYNRGLKNKPENSDTILRRNMELCYYLKELIIRIGVL